MKREKVQLHVVLVTNSFGFPNGMAATQRSRLMSKAFADTGIDVTILCTRESERMGALHNFSYKGNYEGVKFEYTTGATIFPCSFIFRRWLQFRGIIVAVFRLINLKLNNKVDFVYFWITVQHLTFDWVLYRTILFLLHIPVIQELNERPWSLLESPSPLEKLINPLWGARGAIIISSYLKKWALTNLDQASVVLIPALVDTTEITHSLEKSKEPKVLFSGSPNYTETLQFILDAMLLVWQKHPDCQLVLTGFERSDPSATWLQDELNSKHIQDKVSLLGYISRENLIAEYQSSWALLIPLFSDNRSIARFPTKIGEYLSSARPIVTSEIGDMKIYFQHKVNAYMSVTEDISAYAKCISDIISNPEEASLIGNHGRLTAIKNFDYRSYQETLHNFLKNLTK